MNIALLRGPFASPWEMQSFLPLVPRHSIGVFVSSRSRFPLYQTVPGVTLHEKRAGDEWIPGWSPVLRRWVQGASSRLLGRSYPLLDVEEDLARYDIYHALETYTTLSYQAALAKQRFGKPLVLTVWETLPFRGQSHPLRTKRKRFVIDQTDCFMAISERTREMLLQEGVPAKKIRVWPMGINVKAFQSSEVRASTSPEILFVGRLVPEKGIMDLLEAFRLLRNAGSPAHLRIVGQGPLTQKIERWTRQHALGSVVTLEGFVDYRKIPSLMAQATCFALPSRPTSFWEEQFGFVLVEAMASGRAIVTARSGAIPEVVGDAAKVVDPQAPDQLSRALDEFLRNPSQRQDYGQRARQRAIERYSAEKIAAGLEDVYVSVTKGRATP